MRLVVLKPWLMLGLLFIAPCLLQAAPNIAVSEVAFFETKIRPILVNHCYECHSEEAKEQKGGLLLDRRSGWMVGGDTDKAVLPGNPEESLLMVAVRYTDPDMQMPPKKRLADEEVRLLEAWIRRGAHGPKDDMGLTEFSQLGNQGYLFEKAESHWSFQPVEVHEPAATEFPRWNGTKIDRFIAAGLEASALSPSPRADDRTLMRRLSYDLTGLPPTLEEVAQFEKEAKGAKRQAAIESRVDELISSPAFGEHLGRMWLDVARYADTDSTYRPDTKTPHYFPYAFTYRDYVIRSLNTDKPFDLFVKEQFAADLMGYAKDSPEQAALGFLAVGPHANRAPDEVLDDWIDLTTRGLMGITVACARCHDHKYEPVPTADYYSLRGVFAATSRVHPLDESKQPILTSYKSTASDQADYKKKRAVVDKKMKGAEGKTTGSRKPVSIKVRDTELAQLLAFHPGAPARMMAVRDLKKFEEPFIFIRGDEKSKGDEVPRRFLKVLDASQPTFPEKVSGRLQLAEKIVEPENPLTARVLVNRVWGYLMGSYLVGTPSDFGLQGQKPTHPELLDWLAADFMKHGWSVKHLVRQIVLTEAYQQSSRSNADKAALDQENKKLWRANRKRLSIEAIRDSVLDVAQNLDPKVGGRPQELWGEEYTKRRAVYGFINRFNLDPTLRAFDFPTPMATQPKRDESIVASQALFTLNSPFVIDQAKAIVGSSDFAKRETNEGRISYLFETVLQRKPDHLELPRTLKFVERETRPLSWALIAQALIMSNEFQYLD